MELNFDSVMEALTLNPQFLGAYGPKGEPCLTKEEKNLICGMILKKLKASLKNNGQDFFSEFWPVYRQSLATMNWYARNPEGLLWGPHVLLAVAYRKASSMAIKKIKERQPKPVYDLLPQVIQETF